MVTGTEDTEQSELVFVYGTLRRGGSNAFRMDGSEFVGRGRVEGKLHVISWYPGFVPGRESGWVVGEVYRVGPEQMRALDEFEGLSAGEIEGSEYRRVQVPVLIDGIACDETRYVWVYEWKGPVDEEKRIPSGDWLDVEHPRPNPFYTLISFFTLPFLLVTCAGVSSVGEDVIARPEDEHLWKALVWLVLFYAMPVMGIVAAFVGSKRRESWSAIRAVSTAICVFWLFMAVFFFFWAARR